jgi:predicted DNA-binding transcriptional regulator YafY
MSEKDNKRITRLTAILIQLQTKRLITSTALAERFNVSVRTIYRDIRVLEQAGLPISAEDGKGYALMEGYKLPPIMFTEDEANALITIEQLMLKNSDASLVKAFSNAVSKIKAVLKYATKDSVELLANRIAVSPAIQAASTSSSLTLIQEALTAFKVLSITYQSEHKKEETERNIEPFALYYTLQESWALIAYCRLRKDYRMFRLDRILSVRKLDTNFQPHKITLASYLRDKENKFITPDT